MQSISKFKKMLQIFNGGEDNEFNEMAENLKVVYCVLSNEQNIVKSVNYDTLVAHLMEKNFFTERELILLSKNYKEVKVILEMLKDKDVHSFRRFLSCLQELTKGGFIPKPLESVCDECPSYSINNFKHFLEKRYTNSGFTQISEVDFYLPLSNDINIALIEVSEDAHNNQSTFFDYYSLLLKQRTDYTRQFLSSYSDIVTDGCRVILIQGYPGSGKTHLAKWMCAKWANKELLQTFTCVVFLQLRDKEIAGARTLDEIIQLFMGSLTDRIADEIYETNGKGMLIILEGWDELDESKRHSSLFTRLVSGDVLPDAVIVITSRPSAIRSIPFNFISRRIEILGFTEQQVKQNIECYFQKHISRPELVEKFCRELKRLPLLDCFVFVPINLCVALYIFKTNGYKLPETFTDMYTNLVLIQLRRYQERNCSAPASIKTLEYLPSEVNEMLLRLSKMAYDNLLKDLTLVFDEAKIEQYCFTKHNQKCEHFDGMGLLQVINHRHFHSTSKTYEFIHRTLQELLAAWYLSRQPKSYQKKQLQNLFNKNEFEMIWIFYAGLTKFGNVSFKEFFPESYCLKVKVSCYKVFNWVLWYVNSKTFIRFHNVCKVLDGHICGKQYSYDLTRCISREFQATLIAAVMEAQNPQLCKEMCESYLFYGETCYFSVPDSAATPQILSALSYCIAHSGKKWVVHCKGLDSCQADILLKYLTLDDTASCSSEMFSQSNRKAESGICTFDVDCSQNPIDGSLKLIQTQRNLQWVILSYCKFVDEDFILNLTKVLTGNSYVKMLHLVGCGITSRSMKAIAQMLKKNKALQWIGLSNNRATLTERDIVMLLQTICHHNYTVYMVFLDNVFYTSAKVKVELQIVNQRRQKKGVEKLSLALLDAFKYHETSQWIMSKVPFKSTQSHTVSLLNVLCVVVVFNVHMCYTMVILKTQL